MFVHRRRGNLAIDILSCVPVGRLSLGISSDSVGCPLLRACEEEADVPVGQPIESDFLERDNINRCT